jgi:hypothetical protein
MFEGRRFYVTDSIHSLLLLLYFMITPCKPFLSQELTLLRPSNDLVADSPLGHIRTMG